MSTENNPTIHTMHVYLINDSEFIAADSKDHAREFYAHEYSHNPHELEVRIADSAGYFDDYFENEEGNPDRTMIQQAEEMAKIESTPFVVGVSTDEM